MSSQYVMNLMGNTDFPDLPVKNTMFNNVSVVLNKNQSIKHDSINISVDECHKIEEMIRLQSADPKWHQVRKDRITASTAGEISKRRKDGLELAQRLGSKRHVQTAAMKHGLESEAPAANYYSQVMNEQVNVYPSGIVVSPQSPWLAASPDRKVYCPERIPPYGLLEIKCPTSDFLRDVKHLHTVNEELRLKKNIIIIIKSKCRWQYLVWSGATF